MNDVAGPQLHLTEALDFLRAVTSPDTHECLVAIHPDTRVIVGCAFTRDTIDTVAGAFIQRHRAENLYWSVNPTRVPLNKKPGKGDIAQLRYIHVDVDRLTEEALSALQSYRLPPTHLICSGGGYQAFWRLKEGKVEAAALEAANRGVLQDLDPAHPGTHNLDRIMRLPGTINWPTKKKRQAGRVPVEARRIESHAERTYSIDDFPRASPAVPLAEPGGISADRSKDLYARVGQDVRAGKADYEIIDLHRNHPHARDQKDPVRAVQRCIDALRRQMPLPSNDVAASDFWSYLPQHNYLFVPTRELWPGGSVNSRCRGVFDAAGNRIMKSVPRKRKGVVQFEEVPVSATEWLDEHRAVEQMTWAPGLPMIIEDRLVSGGGWIERPGCRTFNLYLPPVPIAGDPAEAGRWLDLVRYVYPAEADYLIRWLAHRVQKPGEKINHAIVLGGGQGIGKDTIIDGVKYAIGPWNLVEVSPPQLMGQFNSFIRSVILRVSEARDQGDAGGGKVDRYTVYEHCKSLLAAPPDVLRVDEKNLREHAVLNVTGVVFTTNHKDGIYLPNDDRRHHVSWSERTKEKDFSPSYWTDLYRWYEAGGYGHVAAYLRSVDLSGFDPKAPPPKTPGWHLMVDAGRAPEDAEIADVLDQLGTNRLDKQWPPAITVGMLANCAEYSFREWLRDRRNAKQIPHRMEAAGYVAVRNDADKTDGRWKVDDKRQVIYARRELSIRDRIAAASELARVGSELARVGSGHEQESPPGY